MRCPPRCWRGHPACRKRPSVPLLFGPCYRQRRHVGSVVRAGRPKSPRLAPRIQARWLNSCVRPDDTWQEYAMGDLLLPLRRPPNAIRSAPSASADRGPAARQRRWRVGTDAVRRPRGNRGVCFSRRAEDGLAGNAEHIPATDQLAPRARDAARVARGVRRHAADGRIGPRLRGGTPRRPLGRAAPT